MRRFALLLVLLIATLPALAQDRRTDEHSYAQPDKVRITDLALDLAIDFDKRQLAGTATYTLDWKDKAPPQLVLDTRDLTIDKVEARNGKRRFAPCEFSAGRARRALRQQADHRAAGAQYARCASPTAPRPRPPACSGWTRR